MLYDPHSEPIAVFRGEYVFLSNFWPAEVQYEGDLYPSIEHAYQAAKSTCREVRWRIMAMDTPAKAKREGRRLDIRPDWESVKLGVMEELLRQKFDKWGFRYKLMGTWPRQLIEVNTWGDRFWGEYRGIGENHLGKLLMKVRHELLKNYEEQKRKAGAAR